MSLPSDEEIRDFVMLDLAFAFHDRIDSDDTNEMVRSIREFIAKHDNKEPASGGSTSLKGGE